MRGRDRVTQVQGLTCLRGGPAWPDGGGVMWLWWWAVQTAANLGVFGLPGDGVTPTMTSGRRR
jgi:hypothetical protein